jgi:hypothetical protein
MPDPRLDIAQATDSEICKAIREDAFAKVFESLWCDQIFDNPLNALG